MSDSILGSRLELGNTAACVFEERSHAYLLRVSISPMLWPDLDLLVSNTWARLPGGAEGSYDTFPFTNLVVSDIFARLQVASRLYMSSTSWQCSKESFDLLYCL